MRRAPRAHETTRVRGARAVGSLAFALAALASAQVEAAPAPPAEPPARAVAPPVATRPDPFACDRTRPEHPDLSTIRYDDPHCRRTAWLGVDVGGVALPARLGLFDRTLWTVHVTPAWSVRLAKFLSIGGRHQMAWYDAQNIRLRVHGNQLELAAHPVEAAGWSRVHDRLVAGVETHAIVKAKVGEATFKLGGVRDTVAYFGYGMDHALAKRWTLGWGAQFRHAWVYVDTQRQVRASVRAAFFPRPAHRLAAEAVGFVVHRNPDQAGTPLPRVGVYGQFAGEYAWMSRIGLGPMLRVRASTGFLSGEAPVWEIREESLDAPFAEAIVGLRAVWR